MPFPSTHSRPRSLVRHRLHKLIFGEASRAVPPQHLQTLFYPLPPAPTEPDTVTGAGSGRITAASRVFHKDGKSTSYSVDPFSKSEKASTLRDQFLRLLQAEKDCTQSFRDSDRASKELLALRKKVGGQGERPMDSFRTFALFLIFFSRGFHCLVQDSFTKWHPLSTSLHFPIPQLLFLFSPSPIPLLNSLFSPAVAIYSNPNICFDSDRIAGGGQRHPEQVAVRAAQAETERRSSQTFRRRNRDELQTRLPRTLPAQESQKRKDTHKVGLRARRPTSSLHYSNFQFEFLNFFYFLQPK